MLFVEPLLGYRRARNGSITRVPNVADSDNEPSIKIATEIFNFYGVPADRAGPADPGRALEVGVAAWLQQRLAEQAPDRTWRVERGRPVIEFTQYAHLARLQHLIDVDETNTLRTEIGGDYLIAPDVTVGVMLALGESLHASVSCKWTIRSDRVQNIRHEAVILTRHRRGRQPHIVAVTAEPLPTRLASIARGTGEVDAVYHVALPVLREATHSHGSSEQRDVIEELISQDRIFDLGLLPLVLAD